MRRGRQVALGRRLAALVVPPLARSALRGPAVALAGPFALVAVLSLAGAGPHGFHTARTSRSPRPGRFPLGTSGRAPTAAEATEITAAVTGSDLVAEVTPGVTVSRIRISRLRPEWAIVALHPNGPGPDPAVGVLFRAPAGWVLGQLGTQRVGHDLAPDAVLAEFGLVDGL